ncbi:MAG: hypothetical protein AAFY08_07515 [Planctomycetota bacterium]
MTDSPAHLRGRLRRGTNRRRRVFTALLALLLVLVLLVFVQTRPKRLAQLGAGLLERTTGATADIQRAVLTTNGEIELVGVNLRLPGDARVAASLFHAERIVIQPDLFALLAGRIEARSIRLISPSFYLTEDLPTGLYTIQLLAPPADEEQPIDDEPAPLPEQLPTLLIRDAKLHFGTRDDQGSYAALGVMQLDGQLVKHHHDPGAYGFALNRAAVDADQGDGEAEQAFSVVGHFDLNRRTLDVRLEGEGEVRRFFMPQRVRSLWQQLEPVATLSHFRIAIDPRTGRTIELGIDGGAVTLPIGDQPPRFTDVAGRLDITDNRLTIRDFRGDAEGIPFLINGWLEGLDLRADPLHLTLDIGPVSIPENPGIIFGLPPIVKKEYDRFKPSGRFAAQARIDRDAADGELAYTADLRLIDVAAAYRRFPLPLRDVRGVIRLDREAVTIQRLTARGPHDAKLTITGSMSPPNEDAVVNLAIDADGIVLDDTLLEALEPGQRKAFGLFFDPAGFEAMIADGRLPDPHEADDETAFDLGGAVDIDVDVFRPLGRQYPYQVTSTITIGDEPVHALPSFWQFPLSVISGQLVIAPDRIEARDLAVTTPTGGSATLAGRLDRPTPSTVDPHLSVVHADLPIDRLLIDSIPAEQRRWATDLHFDGGRIQATGGIFNDADGNIDWSIDAEILDAKTHPFEGGYPLSNVHGQATLTRDDISLQRIRGEQERADHTIDGVIRWAEPADLDLTLAASRLDISPAVLGLIPPDLPQRADALAVFEQYEPQGVTDATVHLTLAENGQDVDAELTLEPKRIGLSYHGQRVRATDMSGAVVIRDQDVELRALSGDFGGNADGRFSAWGHASRAEPRRLAINFTAASRSFDSNTRAVLPEDVRFVLDELSFEGGYDIPQGRLVHTPEPTPGQPIVDFSARVNLDRVGMDMGVTVDRLTGAMDIEARSFPDRATPHLDLRLLADEMRVEDRRLAPARVHLRTNPDGEVLEIVEARGDLYGGSAHTSGRVGLGDDARASIASQLVGVDYARFRDPPQERASQADAGSDADDDQDTPDTSSGRLDASFALDFSLNDPDDRRGHGAIEVSEARLYKQPLATALLDTLNLSLPGTSHFDKAEARFQIAGDRIVFDRINVEAVGSTLSLDGNPQTTIQLVGDGVMTWHDQALDLLLVTRNPGWPHLGPLSDLFNALKDQLVAVVIEGTLEDPDVRPSPLTALSHPREDAVLSTVPDEVAEADEPDAPHIGPR